MSLLVIAEIGEVFRLEGPSDLKKCVELYTKRMNLDQNEIYIVDKNGKTIYFHSMHEVNYDSKFFIFNKTFNKDQIVKIFEENVEKIQSTQLSINSGNYMPSIISVINLDSLFDNDFYDGIKDTKFEEKYGISVSELKSLSEGFMETFDTVKTLFKSLKINMRVCEKIRDNYNYQYNSLECIYKNISLLYEQCYNKYKEIDGDASKMNERNEKIMNTFKESIEKLKTIELHSKMQNPRAKYLIDIYFDESKMNVWKDKCQKSSEFINKKIKAKGEIISTEKNKIRTEKNTNILQLKNEYA